MTARFPIPRSGRRPCSCCVAFSNIHATPVHISYVIQSDTRVNHNAIPVLVHGIGFNARRVSASGLDERVLKRDREASA